MQNLSFSCGRRVTPVSLKTLPSSFQKLQESAGFQPVTLYTCGGGTLGRDWIFQDVIALLKSLQEQTVKKKTCWPSLFQCLGSFSPSTLALVNIHTSKRRWRQMRFMAEHQDINHSTQVIPESKNIFQQVNKDPTVYVREADVPSYGCACQNILIHPLELSTCVFEVF